MHIAIQKFLEEKNSMPWRELLFNIRPRGFSNEQSALFKVKFLHRIGKKPLSKTINQFNCYLISMPDKLLLLGIG